MNIKSVKTNLFASALRRCPVYYLTVFKELTSPQNYNTVKAYLPGIVLTTSTVPARYAVANQIRSNW